ncbi:dnaJ homolog subfamily C member 25 homolog [Aplysia californica]|uniref:DnaJ homolog subfamily C member 25 homolog n=1 Tax=Aplysia californica TaxID=6500 RepID=A0ABM0ZZJ6_APLCA|nr:dnaJ homolog subfamily C member 25 homolog [Aplysia californica]
MAAPVNRRWIFLIICASCFFTAHAFIEGLYCGVENCYDVLGVTRDSERSEISKSYRQLAKKWHPDRHKKQEDKEKASEMFQKIATAYEILKDDEQRSDYDYMLDNPDEYYAHYYYYYRRQMAPKVDVRIVIAVAITVISVIQYLGGLSNYNSALNYLCKDQKYRMRAMDIARTEGLLNNNKKKNRKGKEEAKEEEEAMIRKIIEENMDIRGGYRKPKVTDVLWVQLVLLPYWLYKYVVWWLRWVYKFNIKGEEYGVEEKFHIIRKFLGLGQAQWESVTEEDKAEYMDHELWIKENFTVWKEEKEEEMKRKLAENNRYKMYRRYMKKGGAGQMTFGPE